MSNLSVTASTGTSGQPLLYLRGELDFATTATLRTPALAAVAIDGCNELALDFADVTFLDSSGLGVLVEIRNAARTHNAQMNLLNVPTAVTRVVEIAGLATVFGVLPGGRPVE